MRIYLASRYSRRLEMVGYRDRLQAAGFSVTSRWLNGEHQIGHDGAPIGESGEALVEGGAASKDAATLRESFAREDVQDVLSADCVISFTEPPREQSTNRGGRHVEYGIALGLDTVGFKSYRLIVVGFRENLFHWIPGVEFFDTFDEAMAALSEQQAA